MQQEIIRFQIFLQKNNEIFLIFVLFCIFSKKMLFWLYEIYLAWPF